jgi:multicomponent Na+:H+ antiporter subunit D
MNPLVPLPVLIPLAASITLALVNKHSARWFADSVAIVSTIAAGTVSVVLLHESAAAPIVYWYGGWAPLAGVAVGVDFYVDPLSAGLAAFVCLMALAAFVFSLHYFDTIGNLFHILMLGFVAAMCGFCLSGDLFNIFVFFELMSVAAYALCGYKTEEPGTQQGGDQLRCVEHDWRIPRSAWAGNVLFADRGAE